MNVTPLHSTASLQSTRCDADKEFEGEPMQIRSDQELLQGSSKVKIGQICTQGLLHWKRCNLSSRLQQITRTHFQSCTSTCHVHTFMQKLRDMCWYGYQWRTGWASTFGKLACEKEYVRQTGRSEQVGAPLARAHQKLCISAGTQLEESISSGRAPSSRNDTW